jgi:S-adenosylmethionine synthetase
MIYKTSEWVSLGHSDKMADYISEYILDRLIEKDPETRYGLEVQIKSQAVNIAGEITTYADTTISMYEKWVKEAIQEIGYNQNYQKKFGSQNTIDGQYVNVICNIWGQSPDIAKGVNDNGWGDQGIFFGYYCNETQEGQGYEYQLAKDIGKKIYEKALSPNSVLGLDIKTQVTISLEENRDPERMVEEVIIAVPMVEGKEKEGKKEVKEILKKFPDTFHTHVIINGTGQYTRHGPVADAGTTGRKLVVDFYGGRSRIGGGSPWTKDGTKADLSLNLLAFDLAKDYYQEMLELEAPVHHTEVELSCCIGRKEVLMQLTAFDKEGNPFYTVNDLKTIKPSELIKRYHLDKPIYAQLCREGLFSLINSKDKIKEKKQ